MLVAYYPWPTFRWTLKNFFCNSFYGFFTEPLSQIIIYQMETKIKDNEQAYLHALVLAVTAPNEALSLECQHIAESIGSQLTEKQRDLCRKGVEVCMEYLK